MCRPKALHSRRMVRVMRNDEFSSTALSYRPDDVQEVRAEEDKTRRDDVKNEAPDEGAE